MADTAGKSKSELLGDVLDGFVENVKAERKKYNTEEEPYVRAGLVSPNGLSFCWDSNTRKIVIDGRSKGDELSAYSSSTFNDQKFFIAIRHIL